MTTMRDNVRKFVIDNFLFGEKDDLTDDTSFIENGIVDSTGILELVDFLEQEFSIHFDDDDIIPENLDSIESIVNYLSTHGSNFQ